MKYLPGTVTLFCALFLVPVIAANANSGGRLSGNIKSVSGNPLRNAIIKIFKEVQHNEILLVTRSDSRGFFQSAQLTPGTYFLEVSRAGYQPVTATKFKIDPGQTTSLDIILRDLIDYIDNSKDPRNWDLETVMRSTSDRRFIFRDLPGLASPLNEKDSPFIRSGAMKIASSTPLDGASYLFHPQTSQNGVTTNFAFTEPVGLHSRMILSGQMDFGSGTFWRFRNTFNYRPDSNHDYRLSVGYGRMTMGDQSTDSLPSQFLSRDLDLREPGVQTLAIGLEGNTTLLDVLAIKYGFDYSRLRYGTSQQFINPSIQIVLTPADGWSLRTSFTSRRANDTNTLVLPDGETLDLSEPTLISMVGNEVNMSQIRHSEIAAGRDLTPGTSVEISFYHDQVKGPGLPFMVTTVTPHRQKSQILQMNEDGSSQRGARFTVKHKFSENLGSSIAYVYGESMGLTELHELVPSECLNKYLSDYMRQSYQHAITGSFNAKIPQTKTTLLAVLRWYPGNPLIPVDWFSDQMDIATKSINFEIRQAVPLPDIMGTDGQWDIWVDLRNALNQGKATLAASDGDVVFNRNPRSVRFGISLNFH
ncbi:MAG TPA: carboxypeptidase-like regulatory domain-containing protein [Acidobacteriota bacterium]|nr:carboxypeptidase-like regulatory domain-containing protein [Acidobacteriota bacterium]